MKINRIVKSIRLRIETKDGRFIEVPFNENEMHDIYDILYMIDPEILKINAIKIDIDKWDYIIHDIVGDGQVMSCKDGKWVCEEKKTYIVKKPKWKRKLII